MEKLKFQNKVLGYMVLGLVLLLVLLGILMSVYISDTKSLRRDMLLYAQESIKIEYEKLKEQKEQSLKEGYKDLEQIEKLLDDYRNNSMEIDDLLNGMETEITKIRERS